MSVITGTDGEGLFTALPREMATVILGDLDGRSLVNFSRASKTMHSLVQEKNLLRIIVISQATFLAISVPEIMASVISRITRVQASYGDISGAKETTNQIAIDLRDKALSGIAQGQTQGKKRDITGAKETANQIRLPQLKATVLREIAKIQKLSGDESGAKETFDQARATANQINDASHKARALGKIAEAEAQSGERNEDKTDDAMGTSVSSLAKTKADAVALALNGDLSGAKARIKLMEGICDQIEVLATIAYVLK